MFMEKFSLNVIMDNMEYIILNVFKENFNSTLYAW